ncbi:MAG: protein kinase [Phycisphaerae bacterium]
MLISIVQSVEEAFQTVEDAIAGSSAKKMQTPAYNPPSNPRAPAYRFGHGDRPLPGFTIQRGVGRGGFGEVYFAMSDGGREVALKYLRDNPEVELRGVSHCMNLKSPHLVKIFDVKQSPDGEYFVVMEYINGPSLRDILVAEPNGLGPQKAAYLIREIAKGLADLHDRGIVHRDLKPGNIFYEEGYVKIGDYGLSKFISTSRHSAQTSSIGTVHYMAPEVGSGNYSRSIDIYALGVMLYEMLMGKVPFEGASMGEVLMKHLTAQPEVDQLPQPFGRVIRKALAKDPNDRYQTVGEMMAELMGVDEVRDSLAGFDTATLGALAEQVRLADGPPPIPRPMRAPGPPPVPPHPPHAPGWGPAGDHRLETGATQPAPAWGLPPGRAKFMQPSVAEPFAAPAAVPVHELSPEAAAGRLCYAGFWVRAAAALIDVIVLGAAAGLVVEIFGFSQENNPFYFLASIVYQGLLISRWNGQTLGKKVCGIKVISADGRPCGEWQAFARALSKLLSLAIMCIGYLMIPFDSQKRGMHDRMAGTLHVHAFAA